MPFRSVRATLNHLIAAEALWWHRLTGQQPPGVASLEQLGALWNGEPGDGQWEAALGLRAGDDGLAPRAAAISAQCQRWVD